MDNQRRFIHITSIFLFITVIGVLCCCAPRDPAVTAGEVAREWAKNNAGEISKSISTLVADNNPLAAAAISMVISKEINQRIAYEYSVPRKLAEDRYQVLTTAYAVIEIPVLGKFKVSVNYNLEIDTRQKKVLSANIDPGSFSMQQQ
jgi:hypothetical protein